MRQSIKFSFLTSHSYSSHSDARVVCALCACMHAWLLPFSSYYCYITYIARQAHSIGLLLLLFFCLLACIPFYCQITFIHAHSALHTHTHISRFPSYFMKLNTFCIELIPIMPNALDRNNHTANLLGINFWNFYYCAVRMQTPISSCPDAYRFHFGNNDLLILIKMYSNNL